MHILGMGGGYSKLSDFFYKKSRRLLIPLLAWSLIENFIDGPFSISTIIFGPLHLWYLSFLFEAFVITRLIDKFLIGCPMNSFALCIVLFLSKSLFHIETDNYLFPLLKFYPYITCGLLLYEMKNNTKLMRNINPKLLYLITIVALISLLVSTYLGKYNTGVIFNILLFVSASYMALPSRLPSLVLDFDRNSMGIYLMHHPIIWNIAKFDITKNIMYEHPFISPFVLTFIVVILTWYLSKKIKENKQLQYILG